MALFALVLPTLEIFYGRPCTGCVCFITNAIIIIAITLVRDLFERMGGILIFS